MIIAIDGYEANVEHRVGISRYAYEILRHLYPLTASHTVRIYLPGKPMSDLPPERNNWLYFTRKPSKLWTFVGLPLSLYMDSPKPQIIFSPTHYIPRFTAIPRIMSIMDLSYLRYPELFKRKDIYQLEHWTNYSVRHAKKILTISEYSKHDIIKEYRIPEERVAVTYPGLSLPQNMNEAKSQAVLSKYRLHTPFILSVGTLQPRKNFVALIHAYALLREGSPSGKSIPALVIVGKKGWLYDEIVSAPEKYRVDQYVRFLDFVPDEDLPALYRRAVCFVLPSLYEGFGLPVLEAMANGCIVVVSKTSSLPEIAGEAGIYVEPDSVDDIAGGIRRAISEFGHTAGKDRVNKGLQQVKKFTWTEAAKKTLAVLEEVGRLST